MLPTEKKELLERLNKSGLLFEEINLSGRNIIIHETTGHSARKIGEMSVEIEGNENYSEEVKNALFTVYIPLMACSVGDIPASPDDFFWMKNIDIETWTKKARKINPQIFAMLDAQEKRLDQFLSAQELVLKAEQVKEKKKAEAIYFQQTLIDLLPDKDPSYSLPETFDIEREDFDRAFPYWLKYRALGGKQLPYRGGFLEQPEKLFNSILEIDSIFEKMVQQLFKQWRDQDTRKNG